jgi:hypothetical protein
VSPLHTPLFPHPHPLGRQPARGCPAHLAGPLPALHPPWRSGGRRALFRCAGTRAAYTWEGRCPPARRPARRPRHGPPSPTPSGRPRRFRTNGSRTPAGAPRARPGGSPAPRLPRTRHGRAPRHPGGCFHAPPPEPTPRDPSRTSPGGAAAGVGSPRRPHAARRRPPGRRAARRP